MAWAPLLLSLKVALAATVLSVTLGVALGVFLTWKRTPARNFLDGVISSPLVLPPTVLGYYVLTTLGKRSAIGKAWEEVWGSPIVFTVTGAIVAATIGSIPIVAKAARAAIEQVDPTLPAAARTLGAGPFRAFFTVTLPLAAPGIVAGAMTGFARSLGDFGVTLMVAGDIPGETQTASLYIYDQIQAGRDSAATNMAVLLTVFAVAIMWIANRLTRWRRG